MTPIDFHPEAMEDLLLAYNWYLERSEIAARGFEIEIERTFLNIRTSPQSLPKYSDGLYKSVLKRFPFTIFYRIKKGAVFVIAIAHQKRQPGFWQKRMD